MAVNLNAVSVLSAITTTPVAPLIEGSAAAILNGTTAANSATSTYFDFGSNLTGRYGMRVNLPGPRDFSGYEFATFAVGNNQYNPGSPLDTVANGGMRIYFIDGAGNHAGYNIYGSLPLYSAEGGIDGFLAGYNANNFVFSIALARTPDIASGVVDWSDITAIEVTTKTTSNSRKDCHLSRLVKRSVPYFTGTETLSSLNAASYAVRNTATGDPMLMRTAPMYLKAAAQSNFNIRLGLRIGNGSTATTFNESNFAIGFENLYEYSPGAPSHGPWVQLDDAQTRPLRIMQGASDVLSLTDGSLSSAGGWQWELSGSGVATCTRVQYWRFNGFRAAHGSYIDCAWNAGTTGVEVTLDTVISGGLIRESTTTAIKVLDGAGDYSALQLEVDSPGATYDIELGDGGGGTYQLPNISVPSGHTLRVRNNSATNAVVVQLPLGVTYSTSTAGGTITVEVPDVSVNIIAAALIGGSRVQLYNVTDAVEIFNDVLTGDGLEFSTLYISDKVIRLRADHYSKLPLETAGVLTASGLTFLDIQGEDGVYLDNGIDGSTVTEFTPDGPNLEVDIDDPDGVTNVQRLYAWLQWYMTTESGIASDFFSSVIAIDSANYQIDQSRANIKLDNVSSLPVLVVGGSLTRRDGTTVIAAGSGSIQIDPGKAYLVESGTSGLTPEESIKLEMITTVAQQSTLLEVLTTSTDSLTLTENLTISAEEVKAALEGVSDDVTAGASIMVTVDNNVVSMNNTVESIKSDTAYTASLPAVEIPYVPSALEVATSVWDSSAAGMIAQQDTAAAALLEATHSRKMLQNRAVVSEDGTTVTVYDDDALTEFHLFDISPDKKSRTPK